MGSRDYIPELDGLRAIAAIMVLRVHTQPTGWFPIPWMNGDWGVDLFFVLSGFLITRILLYNREAGIPWANFMLRRCGRIFPLYYAVVLICMIAYPAYENWQWVLFYGSNYLAQPDIPKPVTHVWTLAVEEHFYLVWPALVMLLPTAISKRVAAVGIIACAATAIIWDMIPHLPNGEQAIAICMATHVRCLSLLAGAVLAYYEQPLRANPSLCLKMAGGLVLAPMLLQLPFAHEPTIFWLTGERVISMGGSSTAVVLVILSGKPSWLMQALREPRLVYIGGISYGLYIIHFPIYHALDAATGLTWRPVLAVSITWALAHYSAIYFERPVRDRVNKLADRWFPKAAESPPAAATATATP